uniref:Uncharacterized protein n=1 Tax=Romanomermis culicivorax TaxID=13658 RepID=A0A915ITM2_ROMCU
MKNFLAVPRKLPEHSYEQIDDAEYEYASGIACNQTNSFKRPWSCAHLIASGTVTATKYKFLSRMIGKITNNIDHIKNLTRKASK